MKIAIQGHSTRGKEVIEILKSLGGKSREELTGKQWPQYYFINSNGDIDLHYQNNLYDYRLYTLEKFEKEFPFKVGDKVIYDYYPNLVGKVVDIKLDDNIPYRVNFKGTICTCGTTMLKPYKEMKEERNITLTFEKAKEWYKKGGELKEIALQAFTEKELNSLPRSWEEFCERYPIQDHEAFINYANGSITVCKECAGSGLGIWKRKPEKDRCKCTSQKSAEAHLAMIQLEQLRNCWWNGWEPEWNSCQKHVIKWEGNNLTIFTAARIHAFLVFPTEEMAKEFLKCFRDLIEKAGDLI